jgi:hypothetical protein
VRRSATRQPDPAERCDFCALPVPPGHRHVLDLGRGELQCTCRACSLLFTREAAGQSSSRRGHYRLVPEERVRLSEFSPAELGVPVGLAFFVKQEDGAVLAHYPSPAGATRWEVDADAWAQAARRIPALARLAVQVQALLVDTTRGSAERWIVPIDDCYRLVALVRREWTGLSGGVRVWPEVRRFFDDLGTRSTRPVAAG